MLYSLFLFLFAFSLGAVTALAIAAALVYYFLKLMEKKYTQHIAKPKGSEDNAIKMQDHGFNEAQAVRLHSSG
jgi:LPS O-antigen subunit length determinant protein (WzzB/FepE family)